MVSRLATTLPRETSGIQAFSLWSYCWAHKPIGFTATSTAFVKVCLFCPISLIIDLPLPDSIYDLLDSMMHQQPKKRPSADEILGKLDELDKSLKIDSKRPHGKIETTALTDAQYARTSRVFLRVSKAIFRYHRLDYRIGRFPMAPSLPRTFMARVGTSTIMTSWRNWYAPIACDIADRNRDKVALVWSSKHAINTIRKSMQSVSRS
jgi:hypothetical protein